MDKILASQSIDARYTDFLAKMEKGKYYSQSEMTNLILGRPLGIAQPLMGQKDTTLKHRIERFGDIINDISHVNCTLEINRAMGKLRVAEKNNDLYYAKV